MGLLQNAIGSGTQCAVGNTDFGNSATPKVVAALTLEPSAADCTVTLLHGATGVVAWELIAKANTNSVTQDFPSGLNFPVGLRVTVAGAGAKAYVSVI